MSLSEERGSIGGVSSPTVSREKWLKHAKSKLSRGYVLIVSRSRRNANFYMPGKGYEMCAYTVAKRLISSGVVVETGEHDLGGVYRLSEEAELLDQTPAVPYVSDDDDEDVTDTVDVDDLLDHLGADATADDEDDVDVEDEDDVDVDVDVDDVEAVDEDEEL